MKKTELVVGREYAYSTKSNPTWVERVKVLDLNPKLLWRDAKGSIEVEFIRTDRETGEDKAGSPTKVLGRYLIGEYREAVANIEIAKRDKEIAYLRRQANEREQRDFLEGRVKPLLKEVLEGQSYSIRFDSSRTYQPFTLELSREGLRVLVEDLQIGKYNATRLENVLLELERVRAEQAKTESVVA